VQNNFMSTSLRINFVTRAATATYQLDRNDPAVENYLLTRPLKYLLCRLSPTVVSIFHFLCAVPREYLSNTVFLISELE
jgi:hypothetical protein